MKVMVRAYLDNNLGDDLMIMLLAKKFSNHTFYLYSAESVIKNTFLDIKNVIIRNPNMLFSDIKDIDVFITIGGSIFQVNTSKRVFSKLKKVVFLTYLKFKKKKVVTLGANLGPFLNKLSYKTVEWEIRRNDLVTVRDKYSKDIIDSYKEYNKAYLADDIVYNLDIVQSLEKEGLGISAYRSTRENESNYENYCTLAKIADAYIEKTKKQVRLFAFDTENENDLTSAYHIYYLARNKGMISIVPYLGNYEVFLKEFARCEKLIAIRFHSAILSNLFAIPFIPIIYSNKMMNFLKDNRYEGIKYKLDDLNENLNVNEFVESIISGTDIFSGGKRTDNNAYVHFEELKKILG